jgi:hypothetical protein
MAEKYLEDSPLQFAYSSSRDFCHRGLLPHEAYEPYLTLGGLRSAARRVAYPSVFLTGGSLSRLSTVKLGQFLSHRQPNSLPSQNETI